MGSFPSVRSYLPAAAGATAGGLVTIIAAMAIALVASDWRTALHAPVSLLLLSGFLLLPWLLATAVIGLPVWACFHRIGVRGPVAAAGLGALLVIGAALMMFGLPETSPRAEGAIVNGVVLIEDGRFTEEGLRRERSGFLGRILLSALAGAGAGLGLWAAVYRTGLEK